MDTKQELAKSRMTRQGICYGLTFTCAAFLLINSLAASQQSAQPTTTVSAPVTPLRMSSPAFSDGSQIPNAYTCVAQADVKSPQLEWKNIPTGTVSFALIVHDLDPRPNKSADDILHWMVWNIPGNADGLPENVPTGVADVPGGAHQGINQRGKIGWAGPCPPLGNPPHHYTFELFALDTNLQLPSDVDRHRLIGAIDGHVLGHAVFIGLFNRN